MLYIKVLTVIAYDKMIFCAYVVKLYMEFVYEINRERSVWSITIIGQRLFPPDPFVHFMHVCMQGI